MTARIEKVLLEAARLGVRIGETEVCHTLDLRLHAGECWCLLGRNGSGKTTLLHTLAGLHQPLAGTLLLDGQQLTRLSRRAISRRMGFLVQDHRDAFPASVLETALIGRHPWLHPWQWEGAEDYAAARAALRTMDLAGLEDRSVATLSGGERRRLGIATLLTQNPDILLLDEPTNHLDVHHQIHILDLLRNKAREENKALLMVLHDLNLAIRYCDRFLLLFGNGHTAQGSADSALTQQNLERLYAHPLTVLPGPHGPVWIPG